MSQIFRPSANTIAKVTLFGGILFVGLAFLAGWAYIRSPFRTGVEVPRNQPVPFSHKHHVGDDGIDCRYCHSYVETSANAGIPPTRICMNCHSVLFTDSPILEPVRESYRTGQPIVWNRVYLLAQFVYFNHSIHVNKGIGCSTCHGRVDQMPLTWAANPMFMEWCLGCHRAPEQYVRPKDQVFNMAYQPPANQLELGRRLVAEYKIERFTSCNNCHR
ncbi:MAG TPA: cytochrome c3 family protein [Candidatus Sulfotelmatobacter sp.]|nr:cytochrome c3 family protein [Candidatus Sulfotelmatobacter sp.]